MAYTSIEMDACPEVIYEVLLDPSTYPRWLVGAQAIRHIDDSWPKPGSRFHHRVGVGPFTISDSTELIAAEPHRLVRLAVRARPLLSAIVTFTIIGGRGRSALSWEEEPAVRIIGTLVRPVLDPVTHVRNHRSLLNLSEVVGDRAARTTSAIRAATDVAGAS